MSLLNSLLSNPLTQGLNLDDPQTTELRKQIILSKPFLKKVYQKWYNLLVANLPPIEGTVLELGTGAGFLRDYIPGLLTSDIIPIENCDVACSALQLPFSTSSLRSIVMLNVLHHIPDVDAFFWEGSRCLKKNGTLVMIEPWLSSWSKLVYTKFHHEPFDHMTQSWKLPPSGPLSGGNDALPWIIFQRDIEKFEQIHSSWRVKLVEPGFSFSYLLSGGISLRNLAPGCMFEFISCLEDRMPKCLVDKTAMFAAIVLLNNK